MYRNFTRTEGSLDKLPQSTNANRRY